MKKHPSLKFNLHNYTKTEASSLSSTGVMNACPENIAALMLASIFQKFELISDIGWKNPYSPP